MISTASLANPDLTQFIRAISDVLNKTEPVKQKAKKAKKAAEENYNYKDLRRNLLEAFEYARL